MYRPVAPMRKKSNRPVPPWENFLPSRPAEETIAYRPWPRQQTTIYRPVPSLISAPLNFTVPSREENMHAQSRPVPSRPRLMSSLNRAVPYYPLSPDKRVKPAPSGEDSQSL